MKNAASYLEEATMLRMIAIALVLATGTPHIALAKSGCPSKVAAEHRLQTYHFRTSSMVRGGSGVQLYETCVENPSDRDLWVNWLIPGPQSYVLAGESVTHPRAFLTRDTMELDGCLEYGNLAENTTAHFLGHTSDQSRLSSRGRENCRYALNARKNDSTAIQRVFDFFYPLKIFIPSNRKNSTNTMLSFNASIGISKSTNNSYLSFLSYVIKPARTEGTGDPSQLTILPTIIDNSDDPVYDKFLSSFKSIDNTLSREGNILIELPSPSHPTLSNIRYSIYDVENKFVGGFDIPVWVDSK